MVEDAALSCLSALGCAVLQGPEIAPGGIGAKGKSPVLPIFRTRSEPKAHYVEWKVNSARPHPELLAF